MANVRVRIMTEPTALPEFQDFVAVNPGESLFDVITDTLDGFKEVLAEVYPAGDGPAVTSLVLLVDPVVEQPR